MVAAFLLRMKKQFIALLLLPVALFAQVGDFSGLIITPALPIPAYDNTLFLNSFYQWGVPAGGGGVGYTPVNKAGDSMTGTLLVTGLTNSANTASRVIGTAADKSEITSFASAALLNSLTDETGGGLAVFSNGATLGSFTVTTNIYKTRSAVSWSGTATMDFADDGALWSTLGGSVVISSANLAAGRAIDFVVDNTTATNCNVILPSGWRFLSGTVTNILASGKIGQGRAESRASNDTNVICQWKSE